jgi:hypothetical protein
MAIRTDDIKISGSRQFDPIGQRDITLLQAVISEHAMAQIYAEKTLLEEILKLLAAKYVEDHYQEIVAGLNQKAIANLAINEIAKIVAERIQNPPQTVKRA